MFSAVRLNKMAIFNCRKNCLKKKPVKTVRTPRRTYLRMDGEPGQRPQAQPDDGHPARGVRGHQQAHAPGHRGLAERPVPDQRFRGAVRGLGHEEHPQVAAGYQQQRAEVDD